MRISAFDQHLLDLGRRTTKLLMARQISRADAEDAVGAAFEKVYTLLPNLTVNNLDGWFYRVALNSYLDHYRKTSRLTYIAPPETGSEPPSAHFAELIESLNARDQEVVALKYYYGFSYQEIAMILDAKPATVQKQLARARAKLRHLWEE